MGVALIGVTLVLAGAAVRGRRRGQPDTAAPSRWVHTACVVSATVVLAPLLLCAYLVGDRLGWWQITRIDLTVRSAVLLAPPDAVLVLLVACTALLTAVWLLRRGTWRGPVLAAGGALALSSWFAQLRDLVPPLPRGISFGFTPYAEVLSSHHLDLHGLPGVLLLASLAVTAACAAVPSHRQPPETGRTTPAAG